MVEDKVGHKPYLGIEINYDKEIDDAHEKHERCHSDGVREHLDGYYEVVQPRRLRGVVNLCCPLGQI